MVFKLKFHLVSGVLTLMCMCNVALNLYLLTFFTSVMNESIEPYKLLSALKFSTDCIISIFTSLTKVQCLIVTSAFQLVSQVKFKLQ